MEASKNLLPIYQWNTELLLLEYNIPSAKWESFVTIGNQSFDRQIQSYHKWRQGHIFASLWIPRRHPAGTQLPVVWSAVWWLEGHAVAQWTQQWQHHSRLGQAEKIVTFFRYVSIGESGELWRPILKGWYKFEWELIEKEEILILVMVHCRYQTWASRLDI